MEHDHLRALRSKSCRLLSADKLPLLANPLRSAGVPDDELKSHHYLCTHSALPRPNLADDPSDSVFRFTGRQFALLPQPSADSECCANTESDGLNVYQVDYHAFRVYLEEHDWHDGEEVSLPRALRSELLGNLKGYSGKAAVPAFPVEDQPQELKPEVKEEDPAPVPDNPPVPEDELSLIHI